MWLFSRPPDARFRCRVWLGRTPGARFWSKRLSLRPFVSPVLSAARLVSWLFFLCMGDVTEQTAMSNLCHHHHPAFRRVDFLGWES